MWNKWWNQMRLSWEMSLGSRRHDVNLIVRSLRNSMKSNSHSPFTASEHSLVSQIKRQTSAANRNNLTRTKAYLDFYCRHNEVHWSLLAHCVSRNGGWGMTDVQGEWFQRISTKEQAASFFAFLERSNWLIFQDAYPQLLLYEESTRLGLNLCHLLQAFDVSSFMHPIWNLFWKFRDSALLTRALIINEQNYIESRVVQSPKFQATVESSATFQLQSFLNLNQVLLPYRKGSDVRLAGTTIKQFTSVNERIHTGLRLYRTLFQDRILHQGILEFLCDVTHSASRADYWPSVFTTKKPVHPSASYQPRFIGAKPAKELIYSPRLQDVWTDVMHEDAEPGDWFRDLKHVIYLFDETPKQPPDITTEYTGSVKTVENLIVAKEKAQALLRVKESL